MMSKRIEKLKIELPFEHEAKSYIVYGTVSIWERELAGTSHNGQTEWIRESGIESYDIEAVADQEGEETTDPKTIESAEMAIYNKYR